MYEYSSKSDKKFEKLLGSGLLMLSVLFYFGSQMPAMPLPLLLRLVAFALLPVAVAICSTAFSCSYLYRVELREMGGGDFVIVRRTGRRQTTVCRVSCSSVSSMTPVTKENRRALKKLCKGHRVYHYADALFAEDLHLLRLEEEGETVFLFVLSDQRLKDLILMH